MPVPSALPLPRRRADGGSSQNDDSTTGDDSRITDSHSILTPLFSINSWIRHRTPSERFNSSALYTMTDDICDEDYTLRGHSTVGENTEYSSIVAEISQTETAARSVILSISRTDTEETCGENSGVSIEEASVPSTSFSHRCGSSVSDCNDARIHCAATDNRIEGESNSIMRFSGSVSSADLSFITNLLENEPNMEKVRENSDEQCPRCTEDHSRFAEKLPWLKIQPTTYTEEPSQLKSEPDTFNNIDTVGGTRSKLSNSCSNDGERTLTVDNESSVVASTSTTKNKRSLSLIPSITPSSINNDLSSAKAINSDGFARAGSSVTAPAAEPEKEKIEVCPAAVDDHLPRDDCEIFESDALNESIELEWRHSGRKGVVQVPPSNEKLIEKTNSMRDLQAGKKSSQASALSENASEPKDCTDCREHGSVGSLREESEMEGYEVTLLDVKDLKRNRGRNIKVITQKWTKQTGSAKANNRKKKRSRMNLFRKEARQEKSTSYYHSPVREPVGQHQDTKSTTQACKNLPTQNNARYTRDDQDDIRNLDISRGVRSKYELCAPGAARQGVANKGETKQDNHLDAQMTATKHSALKNEIEEQKKRRNPLQRRMKGIPEVLPKPELVSTMAGTVLSDINGNEAETEAGGLTVQARNSEQEMPNPIAWSRAVMPSKFATAVTATSWAGPVGTQKSQENMTQMRVLAPSSEGELDDRSQLATCSPSQAELDGHERTQVVEALSDSKNIASCTPRRPILKQANGIDFRSALPLKSKVSIRNQRGPRYWRNFSLLTPLGEGAKAKESSDPLLKSQNSKPRHLWRSQSQNSRMHRKSVTFSKSSEISSHDIETPQTRKHNMWSFGKVDRRNPRSPRGRTDLRHMVAKIKAEKMMSDCHDERPSNIAGFFVAKRIPKSPWSKTQAKEPIVKRRLHKDVGTKREKMIHPPNTTEDKNSGVLCGCVGASE